MFARDTKGNIHPQRIQTRIYSSTTAPQKTVSADDFLLRGDIACDGCRHPMTGHWAKGRNKRYPYYERFQKGYDLRRKSIKRADIEGAFKGLLKSLTPSRGLIAVASEMFKDIWDGRITQWQTQCKAQKAELVRIETQISKTADRLIDTTSAATERAREGKIDKLAAQRVKLAEDLAFSKPKPEDFQR